MKNIDIKKEFAKLSVRAQRIVVANAPSEPRECGLDDLETAGLRISEMIDDLRAPEHAKIAAKAMQALTLIDAVHTAFAHE